MLSAKHQEGAKDSEMTELVPTAQGAHSLIEDNYLRGKCCMTGLQAPKCRNAVLLIFVFP